MKKQRKFALIIGIVYCFSMVANAQHQWVFKGETPNGMLYSLSSVNLANMKVKKSLFYQGREKGINLGWKGIDDKALSIIIAKNDRGEITQCDNVAIFVVGGGYLKYESRKNGINLVWSEAPVFEWTITTNNKSCNPIGMNKPYGLFNTKINRHLIYGKRDGPVINLDWYYE